MRTSHICPQRRGCAAADVVVDNEHLGVLGHHDPVRVSVLVDLVPVKKEHLGVEAALVPHDCSLLRLLPDVAGDGTLHDLPGVRGEPRQAGQLIGDDAEEVEAAAHRPEILAAHCLFPDTYSAITLRLICWCPENNRKLSGQGIHIALRDP